MHSDVVDASHFRTVHRSPHNVHVQITKSLLWLSRNGWTETYLFI